MALWKDQAQPASPPPPAAAKEPVRPAAVPLEPERRPERADLKESLIAANLAIEGKIEGAGHVRIAGRFKGDVHVDGNLTIEPGAQLTGQVYAKHVIIGGELLGNINGAARVELLASGVLAGDVKAGQLTVAAGSRMRGNVEFGWEEKVVKSVVTG